MPFLKISDAVAAAAKCPKCDKAVFAAEEKVAGGYKWHKICFKCCKSFFLACKQNLTLNSLATCNKRLDSTTCAEHERTLYCKTCYGRNYGPKGVGFGIGAGTLSMDSGAQFNNGNHQS